MMTVAGLRRSVGVDDVSSVFHSHRDAQRSDTGPVLGVGHRRSTGPDAVRTGPTRGEGDCRASVEHRRTEHRRTEHRRTEHQRTEHRRTEHWRIEDCGSDEVYGVQLRDDESCTVQDACDETSSAQVAVRPLRTQLRTPVCPPLCNLDILPREIPPPPRESSPGYIGIAGGGAGGADAPPRLEYQANFSQSINQSFNFWQVQYTQCA